jgi:DNA-binding transcriptional LysR family regulator
VEKKDPNVLRSLQYFEAVARHRSVKLAAIDLGVTQSAVSHQVRRFSEAIGQQLMVKSGRGIVLTPAGEKLGERLAAAFAGLDELVKDVVGDGQQALRLAVCSSFGPGWLIEKLDDFYRSHPEIDLELRLYAQNPLYSNEVADIWIVADEIKPGYKTIPLKQEILMAVEAPASRQRAKGSGKRRLITTELERGKIGQDWVSFCRLTRTKLRDIQDGSFRLCTHYFLALELARAGHGVALVPDFLARREIRAETVVPYHDARLPSGRTFRLCIKDTRVGEATLKTFANWLVSVARSEPS